MSGRTCDHCTTVPADVEVDSVVGLEAWNRHHPDDPRTRLFFCSLVCVFLHGMELGHADQAAEHPRRSHHAKHGHA